LGLGLPLKCGQPSGKRSVCQDGEAAGSTLWKACCWHSLGDRAVAAGGGLDVPGTVGGCGRPWPGLLSAQKIIELNPPSVPSSQGLPKAFYVLHQSVLALGEGGMAGRSP
jgi:hypothetical protein